LKNQDLHHLHQGSKTHHQQTGLSSKRNSGDYDQYSDIPTHQIGKIQVKKKQESKRPLAQFKRTSNTSNSKVAAEQIASPSFALIELENTRDLMAHKTKPSPIMISTSI